VCHIPDLESARAEAEKSAILAMTSYTKRNMTEAARRLGVTRATLYRLIYKHKLELDMGLDSNEVNHEVNLNVLAQTRQPQQAVPLRLG
jgi:transposase-like protein